MPSYLLAASAASLLLGSAAAQSTSDFYPDAWFIDPQDPWNPQSAPGPPITTRAPTPNKFLVPVGPQNPNPPPTPRPAPRPVFPAVPPTVRPVSPPDIDPPPAPTPSLAPPPAPTPVPPPDIDPNPRTPNPVPAPPNRVTEVFHTCSESPCAAAFDGAYLAHEDSTMFIQCGVAPVGGGRPCYELSCGPGTVWNQAITQCSHACNPDGCDNPCGGGNSLFHGHCDNAEQFIQCDDFGGCFVMDCAPGTVWSQQQLTCVVDCGMILLGQENPCTRDAINKELFVHQFEADSDYYVKCDLKGGCYVMPCGEDYIFDPVENLCVLDPNRVVVPPDNNGFVITCENGRVYDNQFKSCIKPCEDMPSDFANPCTYGNVMNGNIFHAHWASPRRYIECYYNGNCSVERCLAGEKWNQDIQMCVNQEFECQGYADALVWPQEGDRSNDDEKGTGDDFRRDRQLRSSSVQLRTAQPRNGSVQIRTVSSESRSRTKASEDDRVGCEQDGRFGEGAANAIVKDQGTGRIKQAKRQEKTGKSGKGTRARRRLL